MTFTIPRPDWGSEAQVARRGEHYGFQMFSTHGNDEVAFLLTQIFETAEVARLPRDVVIVMVRIAVREVAEAHPEVYDTEPEHAITDAVNAFLTFMDYDVTTRERLF